MALDRTDYHNQVVSLMSKEEYKNKLESLSGGGSTTYEEITPEKESEEE